jgi:hypothetical protein
MSRDLENQLKIVRKNLMISFRKTLASERTKDFLMLSVINLGLITESAKKAENPLERRRIIHEFNRKRDGIQNGIKLLYGQRKR